MPLFHLLWQVLYPEQGGEGGREEGTGPRASLPRLLPWRPAGLRGLKFHSQQQVGQEWDQGWNQKARVTLAGRIRGSGQC